MIRRLPVLPTIIVVAAVLTMLGLGVWQLQRAEWKEGLLAQYAAAQNLPPVTWPTTPLKDDQLPLFRHAAGLCFKPVGKRTTAGQNSAGEPGYVFIIDCMTGIEGPGMSVQVGWSRDPNARINWHGGPVSGIIVPDSKARMRLVAGTPAPGLSANAPPSTDAIPNNHRLYAVQWFSFAAIALVIYGLAVKKRLRQEPRAQ